MIIHTFYKTRTHYEIYGERGRIIANGRTPEELGINYMKKIAETCISPERIKSEGSMRTISPKEKELIIKSIKDNMTRCFCIENSILKDF